ncbi:MAG: tandem-95 repeat protein [Proteobacteria bacterium]|nr:MAG: tandem-95 repeat protein [Pseudomonadota bacterium]
MIRGLNILILILTVFISFNSQAQNRFYHVYVDTDNNATTGCDVNLPAFATAINGAEGRVTITTNSSQPPVITSTRFHACSGGIFDAGTSINPAALGLNTGLNNNDVFEVGINRSTMGAASSREVVIYFATDSDTASDIVLTNAAGGPIILGMTLPVPAIGLITLFVLLLGFLLLTQRHINRKLSLMIVLMATCTAAWALVIVVDGQTSDWSNANPVNSDPINDTSSPGSYADLTNVFLTSHNNEVFFRMDVVDVENQIPVANNSSGNTLEDNAVTLTVTGSDGDSDPLTFTVNSPPSNGTLSAFTVVNSTTSTVVYTPNADFNGNDSFTFVANDGQINSTPATASITVTAVNDAPTFISGGNVTHLENSGPYSQIWATAISAGAANESGQILSFNMLSNDNNGLFTVQPSIDANGLLTFEAATDANGTANLSVNLTDNGGTANGGNDTSVTVNFSISITGVNNPPSFTAGTDQTNNEDAGPTTVNAWASSISAGPPDEAGQTLTFIITNNDNPALFSTGPAVAANGDLSYTSAADANGVANITLVLMDDGGTANGGQDTSPPQSFMITVNAVNDPPGFTLGADQNVLEDSGSQLVNSWLTNIIPGPPDENGQTVNFTVTNNNNGLFSVQPTIDAVGNLSFTPAADAFGSALVSVTAMDNGGTANGGQDTSAPQSFTINVAAVNDAPSFTAGPNPPATDEDNGPESLPWASAMSAGPANESGQTLTFVLTQTAIDPSLSFLSGPTVNSVTGNVEYTAATNAFGSASYNVVLQDNGGTANGGADTSSPAIPITITINPINDPPNVVAPGPFSVTPNIAIDVPDGPNDLLANASDPEGTSLTIQGSGTITTVNGGTVTVNTGSGAFTYDPPPGFTGSGALADSFQYTVCDNGIPLPPACSAPVTVTMNVTGNVVWFIDNTASPGGNGTLMSPFDSLTAFNTSINPAVGDYIFIASGTYNESGITLADNQVLFGQGTSGGFDVIAGISPSPESVARPALNGVNPLLTSSADGVSLALNNTVRGIDIGNTNGYGLGGTAVGNLTISEVSVTGNGGAFEVTASGNFGSNVNFVQLDANTNSLMGINLNNVDGSLVVTNAGAGLTNGSVSPAIRLNGGNLNLNYPGNIINSFGRAVDISNKTAGTVTLSGAITDTAQGISLVNNPASSFNFSGNLSLSTGSNPAFVANNSGTLSATGANSTIDTTDGIALDVLNTTIGAGNLNFQRISAGTASPSAGYGISLNNTGSAGGLVITGVGAVSGSGGVIQNKSGANLSNDGIGIVLNNTQNVVLRNMQLNDFDNFAIRGNLVTDFSLTDSVINGGNGNSAANNEGAIKFSNLLGTVLISGNNVSGGLVDQINIINDQGIANITISDSVNNPAVIGLDANPLGNLGNDGLLVETINAATASLTVDGVAFLGARGDMIQTNVLNASNQTVLLQNNIFNNGHPNIVSGGGGITLSGGNAGGTVSKAYDVINSNFSGAEGNAITVNFIAGSGTVSGQVGFNNIGINGVPSSGSAQASGVLIGASQNIQHNTTIDGNTIRGIDGFAGIETVANVDVNFNATITNNNVAQLGGFVLSGMYNMLGGNGTETGTACLDVRNNVFDASTAPFGSNAIFHDQISTTAHYNLPGYTGSANGESASCGAGVASVNMHTHHVGNTNTMTNGASPLFPAIGVDASLVCGVTGVGTSCPQ